METTDARLAQFSADVAANESKGETFALLNNAEYFDRNSDASRKVPVYKIPGNGAIVTECKRLGVKTLPLTARGLPYSGPGSVVCEFDVSGVRFRAVLA